MKNAFKRIATVAAALCFSGAVVAQDKPLVAGFDGTFAPHAMPKMGGGIEGFNVDLVLEAGKRMGRKIEVFSGEFSGLIPAMNAGKLDFVGAPTTVTPERAANLLFSEGYLNTYYSFVVPVGKPDIKSLDELKGKTVSTNKGSAYDKWLQDNAAKYGFKSESYGTNADATQAVIAGRADSVLTGNTVGTTLNKVGCTGLTTVGRSSALTGSPSFAGLRPNSRGAGTTVGVGVTVATTAAAVVTVVAKRTSTEA